MAYVSLYLLAIAALLLLLLLMLYLYLTWHHEHWKKHNIAYEKPTLVLGNLTDSLLLKKMLGVVFTDIYKKHPTEKVVGWFKFRTPALLLRDPELVHKVLVTDFHSFRNNDVEMDEDVDPVIARSSFVQRDDMWKKSRSLITPAFTTGKIKSVFPQMVAVGSEFMHWLKEHPEELHVKHAVSRYTAEVVARCAYGIEGNSFKDKEPVIHELGKLLVEPRPLKAMKMLTFFVLPPIARLLRLKFVPDNLVQFFNTVLKEAISHRQQNNIHRNDLMQYLIDVKNKTIEVEKGTIQSDIVTRTYTDDDVLAGCIMFFVEGYEAPSIMLTNILYLLAMHPDKQTKLREEVDTALKKGELTYEAINEMDYLNCVFLESIRILPNGLHLQKQCSERYEMDIGKPEKLVIEKGTSVIIPIFGIHNDPLHWEDPTDFRPERFANKADARARAKGVFLPFSDGPRICIGVRIATVMIKVAIAHIVSQLEVCKTSKTPDKIEPDPTVFMLTHKGGMFLRFIPRTDELM